jgi:[NiFe] hydrogenase assembly HybE family chaperone
MRTCVDTLVAHYRQVHKERFRGLPVVNPELEVEAVGMRELAGHEFGVLITPWFMNLVLLPGSDRWDERQQGSTCTIELPGGKIEFTVGHDETIGTTLTAPLFSSVADFPDQALARDVAVETLRLLFSNPLDEPAGEGSRMSRRELFRRVGAGGSEGS